MLKEILIQSLDEPEAEPRAEPAHHARDRVGHRRGQRADGLRQRLPRRARPRVRRLRQERGGGLAGPDQRAGGGRAGGPGHPLRAGRHGPGPGRGQPGEGRDPGGRALAPDRLRRPHGQHRGARRLPGLRGDPQRGAERRPLAERRGLRGAPPGGLPRGAPPREALRGPARDRGGDQDRRRAVRGGRHHGPEDAAQQLLHERRRVRVHPVLDRRRPLGQPLRERASSSAR